jgi:hypothetical protein
MDRYDYYRYDDDDEEAADTHDTTETKKQPHRLPRSVILVSHPKKKRASNHSNCCMDLFRSIFVQSPFGMFCMAVLCWNLPAIVLGMTDIMVVGGDCPASIWLLINGICAIYHITMALYIALSSSSTGSSSSRDDTRSSVFRTATHLFSKDLLVQGYLWFVLFDAMFSFVPLFGGGMSSSSSSYESNSNAQEDYTTVTNTYTDDYSNNDNDLYVDDENDIEYYGDDYYGNDVRMENYAVYNYNYNYYN